MRPTIEFDKGDLALWMTKREAEVKQAKAVLDAQLPEAAWLVGEWRDLNQECIRLEEVAQAHRSLIAESSQLRRDVASLSAERDALSVERDELVRQLRDMNRERDPARTEALIRAASARACETVNAELAAARAVNAELQCKVNELTASKRKLREALERMKQAK